MIEMQNACSLPVGCSFGNPDYEKQVRPILQKYLGDDVYGHPRVQKLLRR